MEEDESKMIALKRVIEEGILSGVVKNYNPKKHLEKLKKDKSNIGPQKTLKAKFTM